MTCFSSHDTAKRGVTARPIYKAFQSKLHRSQIRCRPSAQDGSSTFDSICKTPIVTRKASKICEGVIAMPTPVITTAFLLPFTLYLLFLQARVVAVRATTTTNLGDRLFENRKEGKDPMDPVKPDPLYLATRCHQNYVENIPMAVRCFSRSIGLRGIMSVLTNAF
jgi:MAPEG family